MPLTVKLRRKSNPVAIQHPLFHVELGQGEALIGVKRVKVKKKTEEEKEEEEMQEAKRNMEAIMAAHWKHHYAMLVILPF